MSRRKSAGKQLPIAKQIIVPCQKPSGEFNALVCDYGPTPVKGAVLRVLMNIKDVEDAKFYSGDLVCLKLINDENSGAGLMAVGVVWPSHQVDAGGSLQ